MAAAGSTRRNGALLVALLAMQLLLMTQSVRGSDGVTLLESWSVTVTNPFVSSARWVGDSVRGAWGWTTGLLRARARADTLTGRVRELEGELNGYHETRIENQRLRRLLKMREDLETPSVGATVVTANLAGRDRVLVVDRGTKHGVRKDLPVIASGAAVGKVVQAYPSRSKIRLITSRNSSLAAIVQDSRARGLASGDGGGLELGYVPRFSVVNVGDRVVSSSAEGIFPPGLAIGVVADVQQNPDGTRSIRLDPALDYSTLEEVMILLESPGGGIETPSADDNP